MQGEKKYKYSSIIPPWLSTEYFAQGGEKKLAHGNFEVKLGIWKFSKYQMQEEEHKFS